jgi:hypothetical protein
MVSNKAHYYLGSATRWFRKDDANVAQSEETASMFPIRNADNKHIGDVIRQGEGDPWTFRIFGKDIPSGRYKSKEEALDAAVAALADRT